MLVTASGADRVNVPFAGNKSKDVLKQWLSCALETHSTLRSSFVPATHYHPRTVTV